MSLVLGIDIGTTSTLGLLLEVGTDIRPKVRAVASRPVRLSSPRPGWAEQDPQEWWRNLCALVPDLLAKAGAEADNIAAICVAGMLPAVVLLDSESRLLRPSIQQSDARCGAEVDEMRAEIDEDAFLSRAGNGLNQQLVGAKLRWLAKHEPAIHARIATVFGSYDYINWCLTGVRTVEQNWALEAGVTDIATGTLSRDLAQMTGVPWEALPPRITSTEVQGHVTAEAARATRLAQGTPVMGGAADFIASALGAGITSAGDVLLKFGGSVDILTSVPEARPDPRLYLDYHLVPELFMPNGCMSTGGSVLNWAVETFGGGQRFGPEPHAELDKLAEATPAGAEELSFLPYFLGEKTPIHDTRVRGALEGLTLSHGIGHIWRAILESYGYALRHHLDVLRDAGYVPTRFVASDGGASSRIWMQIIADILGEEVQLLTHHPGSCLGAAWVAAVGAGLADWNGATQLVETGPKIHPCTETAPLYDTGYQRFRELYQRLHGFHA
ncbi:FGGY family carbohydrate kinase [Celeribacter halophilus]|uniref:FGGY family carbohydrate kinase n=1 Tax=Celeribacter halophilus TaxID=576117 RepID=A0AAW7XWG1_9RHOB|nr:FGGY family carbohydrate kinase [Celeribacter halophilus]MDO6458026.1 FGGY family carbohydrate kinase [Celeribacter halophilus]